MNATAATPFELLADYERRSLAHSAGQPEQIEHPGLWRGIGFRIGERMLASGIDEISELLTPPALTPVPGTRDWLLGIANIRGNLVPVVDLGLFLFDVRTVVTDRSRVLLVRQHGGQVGLLVDEVLGQRNLVEEQRANARSEEDARLSRFVLENIDTGDQWLGLFSMSRLARAPDFLQAAV